jgi:hypothetical protein
MSSAGAQLMTWFGVAFELHRDWRNDVEGLGTLFSNHIPTAEKGRHVDANDRNTHLQTELRRIILHHFT